MFKIRSLIGHNQGLFTSLLICGVVLATLYGCNMSEEQRAETITVLAETATEIVTQKPVDISRLLLLLGNLLGLGAVIDNRRKDVHIKTLKSTPNKRKA